MVKKKPGPKPKDVTDVDGKRYEGLRYFRGGQRQRGKTYLKDYHYYDYVDDQGKKRREYFAADRQTAIFEFEKFQIKQKEASDPVVEFDLSLIAESSSPPSKNIAPKRDHPTKSSEQVSEKIAEYIEWSNIPGDEKFVYDAFDDDGIRKIGIREDLFWAKVKSELENFPVKFAAKVEKEQIKYLDDLKPVKHLTLNEIGGLYFDNRRQLLHPKTERDSRRFWKTFCQVVGVRTAKDVTVEHIQKYRDYVFREADKLRKAGKGGGAKWINNRFDAIKVIFNNVYKKVGESADIDSVLKNCQIMERQEEPKPNPKPISIEHYRKVLDNCNDVRFRAILLLALNCGFKSGEVAEVSKSSIDFSSQSLSMERKKNKTIRIACLWNRTICSIQEYQKQYPHESDYLFLNEYEHKMTSQNIRRKWRSLCNKLQIPKDIEFDHIRDACESIPASYGYKLDDIKFLMGHRTGIPDRYLLRATGLVKEICGCIEKHFFPKDYPST